MLASLYNDRLKNPHFVHRFIITYIVNGINKHHDFILEIDAKLIKYTRNQIEILRNFILCELGPYVMGR